MSGDGEGGPRRPAHYLAVPGLDAGARKALAGLTRRLAAAPPARRRHLTAAMTSTLTPGELGGVIRGVVRALLTSRSVGDRAGLAAALVALGPAAEPAVTRALCRVAAGWQQAVLAGVLEQVGPLLPRGDRLYAGMVLRSLFEIAAVDAALRAVVRAFAVLRTAPDPGPAS